MEAPVTKSVVITRDLPFPVERVWRALTDPALMAEWLMQTDFTPVEGADFTFSAAWADLTINCQVVAIQPLQELSYRWQAEGLDSIVTWTLAPITAGTHLRMEHTGFTRDQGRAYGGARDGWARFISNLETLLARST